MTLRMPRANKLAISAGIGVGAIALVFALKQLFPVFDFAQYESAILTAFASWLVVVVKETLRHE